MRTTNADDVIVHLHDNMVSLRLSHDQFMQNADAFRQQIERGIAAADRRIEIDRDTLRHLAWLLD